jgi:phenylalanine-4-hydroxylase
MFSRNFLPSFLFPLRFVSKKSIKSVLMTALHDTPGQLKDILQVFSSHNMNLTHIESHPHSTLDCSKGQSFLIDFETSSDKQSNKLLQDIEKLGILVKESAPKQVSWFPRTLKDLDSLDQKTLAGGSELECDHPGFKDEAYKKRRHEIAQIALTHNCSDKEVPKVEYTQQETETWGKIFEVLHPLHKKHACREYLESFQEMQKYCGFRRDNIPQIQDINVYLQKKTGFRLIPIAGLLSGRDFLNYLAFRVFASTQYIRHHSVPFYTPEPDIVHEFIGHAPMFANKDFADFSQQIGLASLGASDAEIKRLATCYWFSVEFGLLSDGSGEKKAYGAGVLSSVDEILNAVSGKSEYRFFDPFKARDVEYPITKLQPIYFWSRDFAEMKKMMNAYAAEAAKGFITAYDKRKHEIKVYQDIQVLNKE